MWFHKTYELFWGIAPYSYLNDKNIPFLSHRSVNSLFFLKFAVETIINVYAYEKANTSRLDAGVDASTSAPHAVAYYTIDGRQVDAMQKGLNIVKMSDGTSRKILGK